MMFKFLILVHVSAAFPFKCPEPAQWSIRARGHCPDPSKYFCLKNDLINSFSENCTVFDFQQPGRKGVLRGGLDADICSADRYHPWPIKYYTNVSTGCIFLKSECNEEGQVIYGHGNRNIDVSCRCDFSLGYDFIVKPRQPCFCVPSEEDCSCYVKTCVDVNHMLSPDYQCIHVMNTSIAHCKQISKERIDSEENQNQTHNAKNISRKENITPSASWKTCVGITVTAIFSGLISVYCIHKLIHNFCRKEQSDQSVREETVSGSSRNAFMEFKDDLITSTILDKDILEFFIRKCVLIADDKAIIKSYQTQPSRNQILLEILMLRPYNSFKVFVEAIKRSNQKYRHDHLFERMNAKVEDSNVLLNDEQLLIIGKRFRKRIRNGMNDSMIFKIQKWERDDSLFINTQATEHVFDQINKSNCVSVIGISGSGKSTLVRHVALQMETEGYTILPVIKATEIRNLFKPERKTLFIVDDMCGNFTANQERLEEWKKEIKGIEEFLENKYCKLILTCRLQVFQDIGFDYLKIFQKNVCNLGSKSLQQEEKHDMTLMYFKEHASKAMDRLGELEFLPFLCKLYHSQKKEPQFNLELFFNDPFSFYKEELTSMFSDCKEGKYKYCALLLLVIFNNKLEEKDLTGEDSKIKEIISDFTKVCQLNAIITGMTVQTDLDVFKGTFVTFNDGFYQAIHDRLFDFLAFYFGTQTKMIDILIKHSKALFIQERFVVIDKKETGVNRNENNLIPVPGDKVQIYIKRVLACLVGSSDVTRYILGNRNFKSEKFNARLLDYMKHLNKTEKEEFIKDANRDFFNKMFVTRERDIKDEIVRWDQQYRCFGIVIPNDMLQLYIDRFFGHLRKSNDVRGLIVDSRPLMNETYCKALSNYTKHLSIDIASIMDNSSWDFFNKMFVMTEDDIKSDIIATRFKCFGIVIPDELLQQYIEKHLYYLERKFNASSTCFNRPLMNGKYCTAFNTHMRHLNIKQITALIQTKNEHFLNEMFVMTEDDLIDIKGNQYKCVGIVIPDDLLPKYIEAWFDKLSTIYRFEEFMSNCRPLKNDTFRIEIRKFLNQLTTDKIAFFIDNGSDDFLTKMFVMTPDDINEFSKNTFERFGIVIPKTMLQQYIKKCFNQLWIPSRNAKYYIQNSRPLINYAFRTALHSYMREFSTNEIASLIQYGSMDFLNTMFVMTKDDIRTNTANRYENFGFVISDDLLQQYIEKVFNELAYKYQFHNFVRNNRTLMNFAFRAAFLSYIRQLNTQQITRLIQNGSTDFFNEMFVLAKTDIKDEDTNLVECIGIVIPDDLLHLYIERWFDELIKADHYNCQSLFRNSRTIGNIRFRTIMQNYITQLDTDKLVSVIKAGDKNYFNRMFVMTKNDINDKTKDRLEVFGRRIPYDLCMVLPDNMLQQYIERWFDYFTECFSIHNSSRPCKNDRFVTSVRTYMLNLNREKIAFLLQNANTDFINNGFIMEKHEINENSNKIYKTYGVIIPSDMLQNYIERWLYHFRKGSFIDALTKEYRLLANVKFRTALRNYIKDLSIENIASLLQTRDTNFFYTAFVMTEDDIKENAEYVYELFGIIIPSELLKSYIERWFYHSKECSDMQKLTHKCRLLSSDTFRTALRAYIKEFHQEKVASLIQTESKDFLNRKFVMVETDIQENAQFIFECFGIVIPSKKLQLYIEMWFYHLTKTDSLGKFINNCRPLMNKTFQAALRNFMKKLSKEQIASLIQESSHEFFNTMFVMSEDDIENITESRYECIGIEIPFDLLQQYMERWLDYTTKIDRSETCFHNCRPLRNVSFRTALDTFLRNLSTEKILVLISTGSKDFIGRMFVMKEESINNNGENQCECFGIVVPDDLSQYYIERLLKCCDGRLSNEMWIYGRRHMKDSIFRSAVRTFITKLGTYKISDLIKSVGELFFDKLTVLTGEDINIIKNYEITDDMYHYYNHMLERWFVSLTKTDGVKKFLDDSRKNRSDLMNDQFCVDLRTYMTQLSTETIVSLIRSGSRDFLDKMFILTKDEIIINSQYECFGIVIPDNLLQQYKETWLKEFSEANSVEEYMNDNRPLNNVTFRSVLRTYMRELNAENIKALIHGANDDFLITMCVMTKDEIVDNDQNRYENFGIVIPDDTLPQYIQMLLCRLTKSNRVREYMTKSRNFSHKTFLTAWGFYIQQLKTEYIVYLIQTGSSEFLNTMFGMTDDNISENAASRHSCIAITDNILHVLVEKLFDHLTKSYNVAAFINSSRPLMNAKFRTTMSSFLGQLNKYTIGCIMQSVSMDFINKMFVLTEEDIKGNAANLQECLGIVIPEDLLPDYIKCWFQHAVETSQVKEFMDSSRTMMNVKFHTAVRNYIRQLSTETIDYLIHNVSEDFFVQIFEKTKDEMKDNDDDVLQFYILKWFDNLTEANSVKEFINKSKHLRNGTMGNALRFYMSQLNTEKVFSLIKTCRYEFFNALFVKTVDQIKDNADNRYKCFGIVIPDSLLQQYMDRWIEFIKTCSEQFMMIQFMEGSRPFMNVTFRVSLRSYMKHLSKEKITSLLETGSYEFLNSIFVMTEDSIKEENESKNWCEWFGIIIPDDLLDEYIAMWFNQLTSCTCTFSMTNFLNRSRPLMNSTFCNTVRSYMRQIDQEKVSSFIQEGNYDFLNTMFVMTEADIKDNSENRYEWFGIVIPDGLLQQYIKRWFDQLTTTSKVEEFINRSRPIMNLKFRTALRTYMKKLNKREIVSIIENKNDEPVNKMYDTTYRQESDDVFQHGNDKFLNTMFVITEDDIIDNGDNLYECVGIIIPGDLLQHYLEIWFVRLTKTRSIEKFINICRPLKNVIFRNALRTYLSQLNRHKIASLINAVSSDFLNTMFVITQDDIKENSANRNDWFGIVIPGDILQKYIAKWFVHLTKSDSDHQMEYVNKSRLLHRVSFCNAIRSYIRQITRHEFASLISNISEEFFDRLFVITEADFTNDVDNRSDLLQYYIEVWFDQLVKRYDVQLLMDKSIHFKHDTFVTALHMYMSLLTTEKIATVIQNGHGCFLNVMFVMRDDDIKNQAEGRYECFGIKIPDEFLLQYTERWFECLTQSHYVKEFMDDNRPLMHATFSTALRIYMRQLNTAQISFIIQNGSWDFLNTMFVMTNDDIKYNAENRYECFGIVIPDNLLQDYIVKWFKGIPDLIWFRRNTTHFLKKNISKNRPLMNDAFRLVLRTTLTRINTEEFASFIEPFSLDFLNMILVMTDDDIKVNSENRHECLGWVVPDNILKSYIEKWVFNVIYDDNVKECLNDNRLLLNVTFRNAVRTYLRQLNTDQIKTYIWKNNNCDLLNTIFVMTEEDINENAANKYECVGIVIPGNLLYSYIRQWLDRTMCNDKYETNKLSVKDAMAVNRPMRNIAFRKVLCTFIRQLPANEIIKRGSSDFLNTIFVMSEDDIKDNARNRHECIGIVIPADLLQEYIERWFDGLTQADSVKDYMNISRTFMNSIFLTQLRTYIRRLEKKNIETLIEIASRDFVNTMFVMTDDDIQDNTENRYECFGIVIPDDLLHQYIKRLFDDITHTESYKEYMRDNRCFMDINFQNALRTYTRQLNTETITNHIQNGSRYYFNTIFVITEDDINYSAENYNEWFGIVIPDGLLHQYIEKLFNILTQIDSMKEYIDMNRILMNDTGHAEMINYIRQLTDAKKRTLIQTGSRDFLNTMFVMKEEDIKGNAENRYESFGIVIPDDFSQQYIGRLFDGITKADSVRKCINGNRCFKNVTFRIALRTYTNQLNKGAIRNLIRTGSRDFVNIMFVMTEDDIQNHADNRFKWLSIIIPDECVTQYIERWFDGLTKTHSVNTYIERNRCFMNVSFQRSLQIYTEKLTRGKIENFIQTGKIWFVNTMFVMTKTDISNSFENGYECFGIVIPNDLLQQYIERLFEGITKDDSIKESIAANRCFMNCKCCTALQTYMKQLTRGKIGNVIQTCSIHFANTMFVMNADDIKINADNRYECFGIVIPVDMLQQYIGVYFDSITRSDSVEEDINTNRLLINVTGRSAMQHYIRKINEKRLATLIKVGSRDFLNTMFVMTEEDIKDNVEKLYSCFGIIIPVGLLQQYVGKLVDGLTKAYSVKTYLDANRCFTNVTFRIALKTYTNQLARREIRNLIQKGSIDFVNTLFIMTEDDIKDNDEKRYECFGIVIPDDLLHQYIERWFDSMTKADSAKQYIDASRIFTCSKFQMTLDSFISGIHSERIEFLNRKGHIDYLNTRRNFVKETSKIKC